jgi:hypothetical protein
MLGVMGTERYDELKLAQSCFASFQQFMARIQREKKIGAQTTPRHIVEGAMLATLPVQEGIWESHWLESEGIPFGTSSTR